MEPNVYHGSYTPLHQAVLAQRAESVEELLAQGAHPNSEDLREGFTALDLAVARNQKELIPLLVRAGGKPSMRAWRYRSSPDLREAVALLDEELLQHRAVEVAEELALTPMRIEEARRLLDAGQVEEAQSLLEPIRGWRTDTHESLHMRIRTLIAAGETQAALEEAAAVFALYRDEGRYRQALMVSREMRKIDSRSPRPYELELRFLVELGCLPEAARCQQELLEHTLEPVERAACARRYELLLRTERNIPRPRAPMIPKAWEGPQWFEGTAGGNLPAPAAPSMEEWEARFLKSPRRTVHRAEQAWARFEELRGDLVLNVWEEFAPVAERKRTVQRNLRGVYVYPDDQSWSLVLPRSGEVLLIEVL